MSGPANPLWLRRSIRPKVARHSTSGASFASMQQAAAILRRFVGHARASVRRLGAEGRPTATWRVEAAVPYGGSGIGFARLLKPLQFARNRVVMLGIPLADGDLLFGNDATGGQDK